MECCVISLSRAPAFTHFRPPSLSFPPLLFQTGRRRLLLDYGPRRRCCHRVWAQFRNGRGGSIVSTSFSPSFPPPHPFLISYALPPSLPPSGPTPRRGRSGSCRDPTRHQGQLSLLLRDAQSRTRAQPRPGETAEDLGTSPLSPLFQPSVLPLHLPLFSSFHLLSTLTEWNVTHLSSPPPSAPPLQVRNQLGAFAAPDFIQWAPNLPKTRSGKVRKQERREG